MRDGLDRLQQTSDLQSLTQLLSLGAQRRFPPCESSAVTQSVRLCHGLRGVAADALA